MSALELEVYDFLKLKFGEKEAAKVVEFIDFRASAQVDSKSEIFDKIIQKDMAALEVRIDRVEVKINNLDVKISETKAEIIKWMFIFWASQMAATIAFLLLYLRK